MRISDWSSDVCSSDLEGKAMHSADEGIRYDATPESIAGVKLLQEGGTVTAATSSQICDGASAVLICSEQALKDHGLTPRRSEERREGKRCVSTVRSRWSQYH